jgi:hypothetical protein
MRADVADRARRCLVDPDVAVKRDLQVRSSLRGALTDRQRPRMRFPWIGCAVVGLTGAVAAACTSETKTIIREVPSSSVSTMPASRRPSPTESLAGPERSARAKHASPRNVPRRERPALRAVSTEPLATRASTAARRRKSASQRSRRVSHALAARNAGATADRRGASSAVAESDRRRPSARGAAPFPEREADPLPSPSPKSDAAGEPRGCADNLRHHRGPIALSRKRRPWPSERRELVSPLALPRTTHSPTGRAAVVQFLNT